MGQIDDNSLDTVERILEKMGNKVEIFARERELEMSDFQITMLKNLIMSCFIEGRQFQLDQFTKNLNDIK